ncbi:MAG TPA: CocE/NonD family hydrolase [Gammaproteobacteria bacterium]|nr:CocE/NonD family hydrolase [Gammaproteobacteria bacterium]
MLTKKHPGFCYKLALIAMCLSALVDASANPRFEVHIDKNLMIPMHDGVRMAADVYLPAKDGKVASGPFPTLLIRTPYARVYATSDADFIVPQGYALIVESVRGRYGSEGRWRLFRDDPADGYDTCAWIVSQPWSDGGIGMYGGSYDGGTQHAAALADPPGLKALIPFVAATNLGQFGLRHQGAFEMRFFSWLFTVGNPTDDPQYPAFYPGDSATQSVLAESARNYKRYMLIAPFQAGTTPLRLAPDYDSTLAEIMSHGDYDDYWKNIGVDVIHHVDEHKDIPVHLVSGWYDSWSINTVEDYVALSRTKKSRQELTMGPWTHATVGGTYAGEAEFGATAAVDTEQMIQRWMDRWLKNIKNGAESDGPVRIFVMGGGDGHKTKEGRVYVGGQWRTEQAWPLRRAIVTPYYLHDDHTLGPVKPRTGTPLKFSFDPKHPIPSVGGNVSSQVGAMEAGAFDQYCRQDVLGCVDNTRLSKRKDVLAFETRPLTQAMEVTGSVVATLWASSSAMDTDFTAKLVDVYPPNKDFPEGVELNICDGIIRARYRDSLEKASLMKYGEIYKFNIELCPTSILFAKGHRIRVDISSSNFPRFDVNPNTGEPLNRNTKTVTAINSIYVDSLHPSQIDLPVIPNQ